MFQTYISILIPIYTVAYYFLLYRRREEEETVITKTPYSVSVRTTVKDKRRYWDCFTRIVSTLNAFQCMYMIYCETIAPKATGLSDLYYVATSSSLNSLYMFSSYLIVDGLFQLPDLSEFSFSLVLSILHHFVGGLGIYLIAQNQIGFFLGYYFAFTEISTPFLNLSWFFRGKFLFLIFYLFFFFSRIVTFPFLLEYLSHNTSEIMALQPLQIFMGFYGSYTLILLNLTWFIVLTKKIIG